MPEKCLKLGEIEVKRDFNVTEAFNDIQFYWNLAKHSGEIIIVEIWRKPKESGVCHTTPINSG